MITMSLQAIQEPVKAQLDKVPEEMWRIVSTDAPLVAQVAGHLMGMKGKLFRPTLVLLSARIGEEDERRAVTLSAIVELIHLATLVHDDAVDHSALRRGMPTVNALFSHQISVIMGDLLYSSSLRELVSMKDLDALSALTQASTEMTIGEMRQLTTMDPLTYTEEDYEILIRAKTASLMAAACELGSLRSPKCRPALKAYGQALGMAFQIADDMIDYTEDSATAGKPTGLDLQERKVTLPLIAALRTMSGAERKVVEDLFSSPTTPGQRDGDAERISQVVAIVEKNGGLDYARRRGEEFSREAREALEGIPALLDTAPARKSLEDAISYVMERHS